MPYFSESERDLLLRIAEVATPAGRHVRAASAETVENVERLVGSYGPSGLRAYRGLLWALDAAAFAAGRKRLAELDATERESALLRLSQSEATAWFVRAVTMPMKVVQARASDLGHALEAHDGRHAPAAREVARWESRMVDGRTIADDETIEVDCVVVGTGAGGPPVAKALAARGHAVVMLEVGEHFTRADFSGDPIALQQKLYWNGGVTGAIGNSAILVPMGRGVGGSTTVNSGTCYRAPERTMRRWQLELGLHELGPGSLDAYFEKVESTLEVGVATPETLGGCARVIARGAEALGFRHGPLMRNAPGCDGQGVCVFGCPTDAKRSTNLSYVPQALGHGAMLYTHARVTEVLVEGGRAVGVVAKVGGGNGSARRLTVRARSVVLACGTMHTPGLLLRQGIANSSGHVGRHLTLHPASYAWAQFDEPIRGFDAIPQGYGVEEFADQGIQFEGAFVPLSLAAGTMGHVGRRWTDLVERLDELACFGFMVADTSRGRVRLGPEGQPLMTYVLNDQDVRRMVKAFGLLARIYFAAGAHAVFPALQGFDALRDLADVERLEHEGPGRVRAHHIDLSAYHPLGSCRMGSDPKTSVIGPTQESWDLPGLFICDGSAVPGPLGVNPQMTIMALSERAAGFIEQRIESGARPRIERKAGPHVEFAETMSGMLALEPSEGGGCVDAAFTVRAIGATSLLEALRARGGTLRLEGDLTIAGIATKRPAEGTLVMRPTKRKGTLVYDLFFTD
ncbi:MAG TPA: GMC family oxidoreductase, partial [Polyangiaceae bacterium]|nr:GMC family oxidoreductase [Polyangiaceae bacterium]